MLKGLKHEKISSLERVDVNHLARNHAPLGTQMHFVMCKKVLRVHPESVWHVPIVILHFFSTARTGNNHGFGPYVTGNFDAVHFYSGFFGRF